MGPVKEASRSWSVVFEADAQPVRGKFKGQFIRRRHVFGKRTAAEAWRIFWFARACGREPTLFCNGVQILPRK